MEGDTAFVADTLSPTLSFPLYAFMDVHTYTNTHNFVHIHVHLRRERVCVCVCEKSVGESVVAFSADYSWVLVTRMKSVLRVVDPNGADISQQCCRPWEGTLLD